MAETLIAARHVWSGGALLADREITLRDGRVTALAPRGTAVADVEAFLASVPFTDLQVNGGGGVMVNSDPSPAGLRAVAAAHRRLGTGDILPTVITDRPEVAEAAAAAVLAGWGETGILGLHIEGPHLAPARRGTHEAAFLRPLDRRSVELVERLRGAGVPVMITLAPERADPGLLRALVACGAVVSAGHSSATAEEARAAFARGVGCVTHLFNAMDPMGSRAPGLLGAAILEPVACGLICDGIHVSWDMLRLALAARPPGARSFAVSDAMATVGGPDSFMLYGRRIALAEGRLINAEGALAGAHLDLRGSLANLCRHVGLPLGEALAMVTDMPRAVMGLAPRRIAPGMEAGDLVLLDRDFALMPLPA
ncbi:N-acetylglucosamine-6-phosphate deacetylase [Mangrovicoccus algicola]|uniref:N-acetylglucosamine-6-phosphate deacetylase n=1 Tax=Mangrovicoccus algicola TaxID=2771008 RepID=A0A8J6YUR5_9RHOB|nr:amidohydrolase family protein [Mangrovicoccus algicola]MBE3639633.1 N-acetylglucosamine-6-phosphate deacetylase [Mangrovicoccus algicola]